MSKIRISCETEGADIYYTLDGSTPDNSKNLYTSELDVNEACTIKAVGIKEGYDNSDLQNKYLASLNITSDSLDIHVYDTLTQELIDSLTTDTDKLFLLEGSDIYLESFARREHSGSIVYDVEVKDKEDNILEPYKKELNPDSATATMFNYFKIGKENFIIKGYTYTN